MERDHGCVCICVNYSGSFLRASSLLFVSEIQCMEIVNLNVMCHQNNVYDFQCVRVCVCVCFLMISPLKPVI